MVIILVLRHILWPLGKGIGSKGLGAGSIYELIVELGKKDLPVHLAFIQSLNLKEVVEIVVVYNYYKRRT
jgi:hypothetical protein